MYTLDCRWVVESRIIKLFVYTEIIFNGKYNNIPQGGNFFLQRCQMKGRTSLSLSPDACISCVRRCIFSENWMYKLKISFHVLYLMAIDEHSKKIKINFANGNYLWLKVRRNLISEQKNKNHPNFKKNDLCYLKMFSRNFDVSDLFTS